MVNSGKISRKIGRGPAAELIFWNKSVYLEHFKDFHKRLAYARIIIISQTSYKYRNFPLSAVRCIFWIGVEKRALAHRWQQTVFFYNRKVETRLHRVLPGFYFKTAGLKDIPQFKKDIHCPAVAKQIKEGFFKPCDSELIGNIGTNLLNNHIGRQ